MQNRAAAFHDCSDSPISEFQALFRLKLYRCITIVLRQEKLISEAENQAGDI